MATRRGDELPLPSKDAPPGNKHGPVKDLPDEWNFPGPWPDAEPDYEPKPGQKGYSTRDKMANKNKLYDSPASKKARGEKPESKKQAYLGDDKEPAERQNKEGEKAGEKKAVEEAKVTGKEKEPEAATDSEVQDKARKDLKAKGASQEEIDRENGDPEPTDGGKDDIHSRHGTERDGIHQRHRTERRDAHGNYRSELDKMASRHAKELDEAYARQSGEIKLGSGGAEAEAGAEEQVHADAPPGR